MPTKKNVVNSKPQLLAVFLAGMAVSTALWYFSDRLDLAYGQSSDINMIVNDGQTRQNCVPGSESKKRYALEGKELVTTSETCTPIKKYYKVERTFSGRRISEAAAYSKRSTGVTTYENKVKSEREDFCTKYRNHSQAIERMKMTRKPSELASDQSYQAWLNDNKILRELGTKLPSKCAIN